MDLEEINNNIDKLEKIKSFKEENEILFIGIAGGTASGKTSVANELMKNLHQEKVTLINLDSYYIDLSHLELEERKKFNFDHPNSIDWNLVYQNLYNLFQLKKAYKPVYSFTLYNRTNEFEELEPAKIIILEGLFSLYKKELRNLMDLKIFVSAPDDIRLIRRIKRDISQRGRDIDSIIEQYLNFVRPMYIEYVKPTKNYADIIIQNEKSFKSALNLLIALIKEHHNKYAKNFK
ncbi:MAG: uridine kinase [bacterium]|nr:uridine kinase [bacterium]